MHEHFIGVEAWMLPHTLRVRNALTKAEFAPNESPDGFLSLCETMLSQIDAGFLPQEFQQLCAMGLVAPLDCSQAFEDKASELLRLRYGTGYWDYSDPTAMARDAMDMLRYAEELQPEVLPEAGSDGSSCEVGSAPARTLLWLAHQVFDTRKRERFHHETVSRKLVPSLGARHGLSAYLCEGMNSEGGVRWILIGDDGRNVAIQPAFPYKGIDVGCDLPYIVICADFERYQWRYRNGWVYQCVYLDLGHALAALKLLAQEDSQTLVLEHVRSDAMGPHRDLTHEPLVKVALQRCASEITH